MPFRGIYTICSKMRYLPDTVVYGNCSFGFPRRTGNYLPPRARPRTRQDCEHAEAARPAAGPTR
jgi:hypothetical protein